MALARINDEGVGGVPVAVAPRPVAAPAAASNPWAGTAWDNGFLDLDALARAEQQYRSQGGLGGVDGGLLLGSLKTLSGITQVSAYDPGGQSVFSGGDTETWYTMPETQAVYKDAAGRMFHGVGADASGNQLIQYFDNSGGGWQNPTGNANDRVQPIYALANGTAKPVDAGASHAAGWWVDWGRTLAKIAAVVGSAGAAGAYLAPAAGVEAAAVGAGSAGATGATNAALIESYLGTAGYGASSAGLGGGAGAIGAGAVVDSLSGMDLAADAALGAGNNITTAASVFGPGVIGATAGAAAAAGGSTLPSLSSVASGVGTVASLIGKALPILAPLLGGTTQPVLSNGLTPQQMQQAQASQSRGLLLVAGLAVGAFILLRKH